MPAYLLAELTLPPGLRLARGRFRATPTALHEGAPHMSLQRYSLPSAALAALLLASCSRAPTPVIADVDSDYDDMVSLAYLCQEHQRGNLRLAAVTVTNTGAGLPGKALRHARCVLEACGLKDIPVADASPPTPHAFTPMMREGIDGILSDVFTRCTASAESTPKQAPQLIAEVALASPEPVTVVATGPLSNLAAALQAEPKLQEHIARTYIMGGAVSVPGNLCCGVPEEFDNTQEFNIFVDPPAAATVLRSLPAGSVSLVPLDATRHVPVTRAYAQRLAEQASASGAARVVSAIANHPNMLMGIDLGLLYWWDPLVAVAVFHPETVTFQTQSVEVVLDGASAGRTRAAEGGQSTRVGMGANAQRFEDLLLESLTAQP
ncbi:purine nucleosidase/pyrimidine-specific ribonucleoside hydrolase [Archangium gephyra]|uniref:Purine nucleosidase/pyrimidine-specific ribonucleoside hydrolase n=2 Tax=Archangium gephyra TaxID=48 RepID=A0ABX9JR35_9BACT|nr:purine nucleosidase/pyrimidine-specific ribonucleoside hydrolase [Archangium gephyra]